jgi:hypothetical protein
MVSKRPMQSGVGSEAKRVGWYASFIFFFDCTVFFTHRNSLDLSFFSNSSILIYNCFNNGVLFRDPYLLILTANDMVRLIG